MTRASDDQAGRRLSQEVSSATDMEETAEKTTTNLNLQKVPTTTGGEEAAVLGPEPDELPNGGLRAWLQVLGGFLLFFNSWLVFFGLFGQYLIADQNTKGQSSTPSAFTRAIILRICSAVNRHPTFHGSDLYKASCSSLSAASPGLCLTPATFESSSLRELSWLSSAS